MATLGTKKTTTRRKTTKKVKQLVSYSFQGENYVLDLARDRVYHNWMAVETNKGVSIIGAYKASITA